MVLQLCGMLAISLDSQLNTTNIYLVNPSLQDLSTSSVGALDAKSLGLSQVSMDRESILYIMFSKVISGTSDSTFCTPQFWY